MNARGEVILKVRGLSVGFHSGRGHVQAVDDVSFELRQGEVLAIMGESGSGKSVAASAILGLIDIPPGRISGGRILFEGMDLLTLGDEERRKVNGVKIAMVFQDPLAALNPVYSVGSQIVEAFKLHRAEPGNARDRAVELLDRVGIPDPARRFHQFPHQFSGGQRQRIMIAMALALKPDILIADEPTTALDVTVQAGILKLLRGLQREYGMAMLFITHDLGVVAAMADHVAVMQKGRIVETGTTEAVFSNPAHPYTRRLLDSAPGRGPRREAEAPDGEREAILSVGSLSKRYGAFTALEDVGFSLYERESLGVVGESGSGKTTLTRILLGIEPASEGSFCYRHREIADMDRKELFRFRRQVQVVFQDPTASLNPYMSVAEIISEPWIVHKAGLDRRQRRERVLELLEQVGLQPEHAERFPHQFSGGQRQRIAIARALALKPELIICDEAVSSLDVSIQAQILGLLADLKQTYGLSYLFVAHDLHVVRDFCDRVLVMKAGEIVESGPTATIFSHPTHDYTRALIAASLSPTPRKPAERAS